MGDINSISDLILSMTLGMARLYPCLLMIPIFAFHELKGMLRYAVINVMALLVAPGIDSALPPDHSHWSYIGLFMKEAVLGMILGSLLSMPFWLFESIGGLFDNARGALSGGQLNPSLGQDFTPLGFLFKQCLIVTMISSGAFLSILQVIWDSYLIWPPNIWFPNPNPDAMHAYLDLLSRIFNNMVLYALPLVVLLLLIDFGVSILSLYSPQLQAFVLSMPLKCLAGMGFLILYIPTLILLAEDQGESVKDLSHLLPQLFQH